MGGRRSVRSALRWGTSDDVDALEMKNTEDSYSGTLYVVYTLSHLASSLYGAWSEVHHGQDELLLRQPVRAQVPSAMPGLRGMV